MSVRGCVLRQRCLRVAGLMLAACLLVGSARLYGQREVIATSSAVSAQTPADPHPSLDAHPPSVAPAPASPPQAIQQVAYIPDAPATQANPGNPGVNQPPPAHGLPPSALLSGLANTPNLPGSAKPAEVMTATMLSVEVAGPDRLLLGQPLTYEIVIRNTGGRTIADIHVEEPLPAGARAVKADPPAVKQDNRLVWDLHNLESAGERHLKVELDPGRPGVFDLRPSVSFQVGNGLRTQVMRPPFSIELIADRAKVMRGETVRFRIQLANHGDAPVQNIKIYDTLPSGLHHPRGPKIGIEHFGDLLPGETRSIALETTAVETGPIHNEILAQADRGVESKGVVDLVVTEPNLALRMDGPTQADTHHELDFQLEVVNPAALTAKNVRLVQTLPPTFEVVSAKGAALDSNLHALVWALTDLGTGQRQRVTFRVRAYDGGDWPMTAAVMSQNFPEARVSHTLHAEASAVLKWEVHARQERLTLGSETVIRIHVFNTGGAACPGMRLTATLPACVVPFKADGPSNVKIEDQQVRFAPLPQLEAHGDVVYSIHVRSRQAGKGSLRVELTAEKQTPAEKEISIQVNATDQTAAPTAITKSLPGETLR
jgi:uncharacterized repeat protein (TIGR01451 family)